MSEGFPTSEEIKALVEAEAGRRGCKRGTFDWDLTTDDIGERIWEFRQEAKGDARKFRGLLETRYGAVAAKAFSIHDLATHEIPVPTAEEIEAMKAEEPTSR